MARLPSISVVTTSFNQGAFLADNLRSVSGQQDVRVEHILLDGGSTDDSRHVVEQWGGHLAYARFRKDEGQTRALMEGFERASGEILCWLNSDDYFWDQRALVRVASAFADNPDVAMVSGDCALVNPHGTPVLVDMPWRPSARQMRHTMAVPQQSTFWRAETYRAVGGIDPAFSYCMDFDLFQRMSQGRRMLAIPHTLAAFRLHPSSKTATWGEVFRREVALCQSRYGKSPLHALAVKAVTMELRLGSALAELKALAAGRKPPCLANARWEPCRAWVRRKYGLAF